MSIKIKPEVWAVFSEEFGGYDYVEKSTGFLYNAKAIVGGVVQLWSINANGRTLYKCVDEYRFNAEFALR